VNRMGLRAVIILTAFFSSFEATAAPPMMLCEATACETSTSSCYDCMVCSVAPGGYCAPIYEACVDDDACLEFGNCQDCGWGAPPTCQQTCLEANPEGAVLWAALLDCLECVVCRGCVSGAFDPWPGCGQPGDVS